MKHFFEPSAADTVAYLYFFGETSRKYGFNIWASLLYSS